MTDNVVQNFENHTRIFPIYHYVTFPLLAINFFFALYQVVTSFSAGTLMGFGLAIALVLLSVATRVMVVTVQDRVIRLEERLRMRELLPADLHPRIADFTITQLVALRFASDAELPALARKVLDDKIADAKAIKRMVTNWRGDHQRA